MKKLFLLVLLTLTLAACFNRGNNDSSPSPNAAEPTPDDWQPPDYLFRTWGTWWDSNELVCRSGYIIVRSLKKSIMKDLTLLGLLLPQP
jgi:hypothetical protein